MAGTGECDTCLDGFYKNDAGDCIGKSNACAKNTSGLKKETIDLNYYFDLRGNHKTKL